MGLADRGGEAPEIRVSGEGEPNQEGGGVIFASGVRRLVLGSSRKQSSVF